MPLRAVGRNLRRLVLPLVGFWEVVRRIEELRAEIAAAGASLDRLAARSAAVQPSLGSIAAQTAALQPSLDGIAARFATEAEYARVRHELATGRHDAVLGRIDDLERRLVAMEAEQARARATDDLAKRLAARNGPLAAVVAAEIDRLDGYLVHHADTLRHGLDALRTEVEAAARGPGRRVALAYAAPGMDAVVLTGSFDVVVPAAEQSLLLFIVRHGFEALEPGVRALLRRRVRPGATVIDAGANIGAHSLGLAELVGPEGRVHCFEPLPHLAAALERTLRLNSYTGRARVERAALADEEGEAVFHRAVDGPLSSLYALPPEAVAEDVRVRVTTLDAFLPPGSRVDLVKMDVEGAEPRVWRGMQRVVADNPAVEVVLEWSGSHFRRSGEDPDAFMAAIRAAGFRAFAVEGGDATPGRLAPVGDPAGLEAANLLLTRREVAPEEMGAG